VSVAVLDQNVVFGTAILDVDHRVQLFADFDFVLDNRAAWSFAHQDVHPALEFSLFLLSHSGLVDDQSLHCERVERNGFDDLLAWCHWRAADSFGRVPHLLNGFFVLDDEDRLVLLAFVIADRAAVIHWHHETEISSGAVFVDISTKKDRSALSLEFG
jgi:hypothetical protein